jgi:sugar phosphate isomerase/epimerase
MDMKDFIWEISGGKWRPKLVPLGEGMVDYPQFLKLVKQYNISGPMSMHFEYPLGGAENGKKEINIPGAEVLAAMKRDLTKLRQLLREANLG